MLSLSCVSRNGRNVSISDPKDPTEKGLGEKVTELDPGASYLFQDQQEHYWFASREKGVYRYDGTSFTLFTSADGLCSSNVLSLQEDRAGNLYFDTPEGVCRFDGQQFTTLEVIPNGHPKNEWKLQPDDLWFRMGWDHGGPFRYDGKSLYELEFPKNDMEDIFNATYPNVSFNPYGVYTIYKAQNGDVWFGTSSLGIYRYDGKKLSWMFEEALTNTPEGGSFGIRSFAEDRDGYFWICNTNQKYKMLSDPIESKELLPIPYKQEKGILPEGKNAPYLFSMVLDNEKHLWMASGEGVWKNTGSELLFYPIMDNGQVVPLFTIHKDRQGTLWASAYSGGTYRFNGTEFVKFIR